MPKQFGRWFGGIRPTGQKPSEVEDKRPAGNPPASTGTGGSEPTPDTSAGAESGTILPVVQPVAEPAPPALSDVIGQSEAVRRLKALADRSRNGNPVHFLLIGPDGNGRRTLARAFAREIGTNLVEVSASAAVKTGADFMGILTNLAQGDVLLIYEIERFPRAVEEFFPPALNDFSVDFVIDKGLHARTLKYALPRFTCVLAVERDSDIPPRIRSLFPVSVILQPYSVTELGEIAQKIALTKQMCLPPGTALLLARIARGSAQRLKTALQLLEPSADGEITEQDAANTLSALGFDVAPHDESTGSGEAAHDLMQLSGVEFERVIANLLRAMGFRAELARASGDGGIDIVAVLDRPLIGGRYLIQCKRFTEDTPVSAPVVREFYGAFQADRSAVKAILITTSDFTAQARQFAEGLPIELISGEKLKDLLSKSPQVD